MNILIVGLNYAPEPVGIGPYTAGMAVALAEAGHAVTVICAQPYYPRWQVEPGHEGCHVEQDVRVIRLPIYVPARPSGARRLLHHLSFALRALPAAMTEAMGDRPDVVVAVAPSLVSSVVARMVARLFGAPLWLHLQDFEVDAAFATGLLAQHGLLARAARAFEAWALRADRISTISPQMRARLLGKGLPAGKVVEFRNWAAFDAAPAGTPSRYRAEWEIERPHIALYSGAIANKQGLELVLAAARRLRHRTDLMFVICGEGPLRERLMAAAAGLDNVQFRPLQPRERLPELLGLATLHLLPQIAGAADLLLPSKLTNMLASGRPVVAAAAAGTGLADEVEGCGLVVPPGDCNAFAQAVARLLDEPRLRGALGLRARQRAEERWSGPRILGRFARQLQELAA